MLRITIAIAVSYLLGAIPTAYIFGKLLKGIDIRKHGSGNVGATNALRVLGKGTGITVLILDILKGVVAIACVGAWAIRTPVQGISPEFLLIILGVVCICGHNWTVFLNFKGGKGVATSLGVLVGFGIILHGLMWVLLLVVGTWLAVFLATRIVSLGSIIAACALPIYMLLFRLPNVLIAAGAILGIFVIVRHKANISRLFKGQEPRITFKKSHL